MRDHYSSVAVDEKRQALAAVVKLVPLTKVEPEVEPMTNIEERALDGSIPPDRGGSRG